MNLNQSFILEVKTEFQPVIKNLSKYEAFINHLFQKDPYPLMSLETLKNGCLYFFKSGREFMDFVDQVVEKLLNLEEKIEFHKKSKLLNFFVHRVLKKKTFPAEGTEFLVRFIGNDRLVKEFFDKYNKNYGKKILDCIHPDINLKVEFEKKYVMKFPNYESLLAFGNFLFYFVYKFDKQSA